MKSYEYNYEYYLDIEYTDYKNSLIEYKINDKENYKIRIYQNSDDKFKFNYKDWNNHISYLEPFYSTLKFKIKEERITRKLRNEFNEFKNYNNNQLSKLSNDIMNLKKYIIIYTFLHLFLILFHLYKNLTFIFI